MKGKQGKTRRQQNAVRGLGLLITRYEKLISARLRGEEPKKMPLLSDAQILERKQMAELCLVNTIRNLKS